MSRDSSVWRTLAIAFGDGTAIGKGIKRAAERPEAPVSMARDLRPLNDLLTEIEQRIAYARTVGKLPVAGAAVNRKAADAVVKAIDGRFIEIGGQIDRRMAELEVKVKMELGALDAQDRALAAGVQTQFDELRREIGQAIAAERQSIDAGMRGLRAQMTTIHKEFAETLAHLVDEQITRTVNVRLQATEGQMREAILDEARRGGQGREVTELRQRVESQEVRLQVLAVALEQAYRRDTEHTPPDYH